MNDVLMSPIRLAELETLVTNCVRKALLEQAPEAQRKDPAPINASGTQTSSFHEEERHGRISKRQDQILAIVRDRKAVSCREAATILGTFPSNLTAAFKNLEESGKLVVRSEEINPDTRKPVMLYELNDSAQ